MVAKVDPMVAKLNWSFTIMHLQNMFQEYSMTTTNVKCLSLLEPFGALQVHLICKYQIYPWQTNLSKLMDISQICGEIIQIKK